MALNSDYFPAFSRIPVAHGFSTVLPDMDFETYSEAGYVFDPRKGYFVGAGNDGKKKGLELVGTAVYAAHPSTEVLELAYNLKDGLGPRLWIPGMAPPADLLAYLANGGLIEAFNSFFEYNIWNQVCVKKLGWQPLPIEQLRCAMSKAAAFSYPMGLEKLGIAINAPVQKDKAGHDLMMKLSQPRKPTAKDKSLRYKREYHPKEFDRLGVYCVNDISTESCISAMLPDLRPDEVNLWLLDQKINARGAHVDIPMINNCIAIVNQAFEKYVAELTQITGGLVNSANELEKMEKFLGAMGLPMADLTAPTVKTTLAKEGIHPICRRVLELRQILGSSSVKKLFAMLHQSVTDSRIRGLFAFCGADRTGRFAGRGPQPQNLPSSGPVLTQCDPINGCGHHYRPGLNACPWCGADSAFSKSGVEWNPTAALQAFKVIQSQRLDYVEHYYGDAIDVISACLRGLFTAEEGKDLICSDFSAIEAVVAAELSGEEWRRDVFRTHGKIYEMGASKISGVPFDEILDYKKRTGEHHPLRKKIGKVSELASGYGGWIGAWENFGAGKFLNTREIKEGILAWRAASPMIVEMWGGQWREVAPWEFEPELYGLEGAAVSAVMSPGQAFAYRDITYQVHGDVLYCRLPSGRLLNYHRPRLVQKISTYHKKPIWSITYEGQNDKNQWVRLDTYGGKLFENVVQAVARDILTFSMQNLEAAGYTIVLHIHDEIVAEIPQGWGSIEEFERIMSTMPDWAKGWPVKANGGWRGLRYRKE